MSNDGDEYISCQYCNTPIKQKNLKKHLNKKCKRDKEKTYKTPIERLKEISPSKKEEEIDMSEMKDFVRLEELYTSLILNENKFSLVESQKLKNNIKTLESYFLEKEILSIKNKVDEKLGKKIVNYL